MKILYKRSKKNADRVVRCYLTLDCTSSCSYCSAGIPKVKKAVKRVTIPAEEWAEGLNRRNRACVLAGGEPFLYPEFGKLISLINRTYPAWIYSNLEVDPKPLIDNATKPFPILASLHQWADFDQWYKHVQMLWDAGHFIKFHIIKSGNYRKVIDFLVEKEVVGKYNTHLCGDQRSGIKSRGHKINHEYPLVTCSSRIFLYGPNGFRYHCVSKMGRQDPIGIMEHISEEDGDSWSVTLCDNFGLCTGCDNNIEGEVTVD
jgi:hypothetical protein